MAQVGTPNVPPAGGEFSEDSWTIEDARLEIARRAKEFAFNVMQPTDWLAHRMADTLNKPVPTLVQQARANLRNATSQVEAALAAATTKQEVSQVQWASTMNAAEDLMIEAAASVGITQKKQGLIEIPEAS